MDSASAALEAFPWGGGVVAGIGTFLAGYLVFLATVLVGARSVGGPLLGIATQVSYFFYNAHLIPTERRLQLTVESNGSGAAFAGAGGSITREGTTNALLTGTTALPVWLYLLVPVVVLVGAGVLFARYALDSPTPLRPSTLLRRALSSGAALALGYLLAALLGTYIVAQQVTQGEALRARNPARLQTLLFGLVYPLVLGTVGAGLGQVLDRGDDAGADEE